MFCIEVTCAVCFFFFNDTATTEIYTLSLHDALPIYFPAAPVRCVGNAHRGPDDRRPVLRSEEHTSELQSQSNLVCRLLLEKKKYQFSPYRSVPSHPIFNPAAMLEPTPAAHF